VDDYALAPSYHSVITKAIQEQLSDFQAHTTPVNEDAEQVTAEPPVGQGRLEEDDMNWWGDWRTTHGRRFGPNAAKRRKVGQGELPLDWDEIEHDESKTQEEMRIVIKVSAELSKVHRNNILMPPVFSLRSLLVR
jgi:SWI/SNF-related matrix-associated actin-dependent regulator of chromatin subfamily B member 1